MEAQAWENNGCIAHPDILTRTRDSRKAFVLALYSGIRNQIPLEDRRFLSQCPTLSLIWLESPLLGTLVAMIGCESDMKQGDPELTLVGRWEKKCLSSRGI